MDNVQDFWRGLSDFWTGFENRKEVEDFWTGMLGSVREQSKTLYRVYLTPFQENSPAVWDEVDHTIECVVSGNETNYLPGTTMIKMPVTMEGTFSIPVLKGVETGQVLVEYTDYTIVDDDKINFTTLPEAGYNLDRVTLVAPTSKRTDSTVFRLHRKIAGILPMIVNQAPYHPFTYNGDQPSPLTVQYREEKAKLIKYTSWALMYLKRQIPTMANLKKLFNVIYNLPFAYEGGVATVVGNTCTIGDYTYFVSSDGWSINNGDVVERFDPLTDGITLTDRTTDLSAIQANFDLLQEACGVILNVTLRNRSDYITSIVDDYINNHFDVTLYLKTTFDTASAPVYIEYDTGGAGYDVGVYL